MYFPPVFPFTTLSSNSGVTAIPALKIMKIHILTFQVSNYVKRKLIDMGGQADIKLVAAFKIMRKKVNEISTI